MKKPQRILILLGIIAAMLQSCINPAQKEMEVYETSENGHKLSKISAFPKEESHIEIRLHPEERFQRITGIGGSFTEASAHILNQLSRENRMKILEAYFGEDGARYSLTRTHINSCDFSLGNYSFAPVAGDTLLEHFSIEEDKGDIIPMIKDALALSKDGFRLIASPWTAPPWMKDNNDWRGGKLLPSHYETWALFFSKYLTAYASEGIDIWGITVENEPLGNDSNWESMHFRPEEMNDFVKHHLGPRLREDGHEVQILGFDQNRDEQLRIWVDAMFDDTLAAGFYGGTAIHWYASTYDHFPEALQYAHSKAPGKHLIQTEACIDAEKPRWKDDAWYWAKEAKDWGYTWAPEDQKYLHPKYVPVFRYARDIIGCLNNGVDGWIDWNMVLDREGGPNWAENWCVAPVIADPDNDEVYFTPLYYTLAHFSRFIRPGSTRIGLSFSDPDVLATAVENPDGTYAVVLFNPSTQAKGIRLTSGEKSVELTLSAKAIQTVVLPSDIVCNNDN